MWSKSRALSPSVCKYNEWIYYKASVIATALFKNVGDYEAGLDGFEVQF
jgi:hypothetical protein